MRIAKQFLYFLFFLFFVQNLQAQGSDRTIFNLAKQAEADEAYEIAIGYYEKLYSKTGSDAYFNSLIELYQKAESYKAGEKMIRKRIKTYPKRAELLVDLGHFYELQEDQKNANKSYKNALNTINQNTMQTRVLANRFSYYKKYKWVEKSYMRSREVNQSPNLFQFELAAVYAEQGRTEDMVDEYLNILGRNNGYIQTVQNLFQRFLYPDPEGTQMNMLRERILEKIQSSPNQDIYSELMIWLYIQDKNFKGAYLQAKALDRRAGENGKRLYNLAILCISNKEYALAESCFNYVIQLGDASPYLLAAKIKRVDVAKLKVLDSNYSQEDLIEIRDLHLNTIEDLGESSFTFPTLISLADWYAYYLNDSQEAIRWYERIISLPGLEDQALAQSKIALGDIMLIEGEIWEASLLYSQVEKAYKYDQIGEIAKLKNAKVAFYTGDFYWAQAQLNVLKGSTSKLIANDAMDLSLLITDNIGLDSIPEPLEMYARADLLWLKKDREGSRKTLDSIDLMFPSHHLKDDVLFFKYKMAYANREYLESSRFLEALLEQHADDLLGDDALFALAKLKEEQLALPEEAMELYKKLITEYPASLFVVESRKRFRNLRGDKSDTPEELNTP